MNKRTLILHPSSFILHFRRVGSQAQSEPEAVATGQTVNLGCGLDNSNWNIAKRQLQRMAKTKVVELNEPRLEKEENYPDQAK